LKVDSNSKISTLSKDFGESMKKLTDLSQITSKVLRNFEKRHSLLSEKIENECVRKSFFYFFSTETKRKKIGRTSQGND
jgi:hypothetical protein